MYIKRQKNISIYNKNKNVVLKNTFEIHKKINRKRKFTVLFHKRIFYVKWRTIIMITVKIIKHTQ